MRKETTTRKLFSGAGALAALLLWCLPYAAQAEGPPGYTLCANEGGTCTFSGKQGVAYGVGGRFYFREPTGSIGCNVNAFGGDPNFGVLKACYRAVFPPGNGWTQCATENGTCSVSGSQAVVYGAATNQFYQRFVTTGSIACNNATWGDPAPGTFKACYTKSGSGGCTAQAINPYLMVSGGAWQNVSSVTITAGQSVTFGPQPTDGTWTWSTGATTREITVSPSSATNYTATYRDTNGCTSSRVFTVTVNGSGSSSSSSSSGGQLPRHALVGYWHNFSNPSGSAFPLSQVSNTWDVIVVAFAVNAGNGNVSFAPDPAAGNFRGDIGVLHSRGKKVILSLGGQDGSVSLNDATQTANFVRSLGDIIASYGFDGIDIDLESGSGIVHGAPVINNLISAVKQLRSRFGSNFYVSMAPEHPYVQGGTIAYGGIWGAYIPLINGLRNELTLLHVQLYNNGGLQTPYSPSPYPAGTVDMLTASVKMLVEGFPLANGTTFSPLRADQVALGLPSGPSSAGSGQAPNSVITASLDCITRGTGCGSVRMNSNQPNFRGVMTWSINWDRRDGFIFSGPIGNKVHTLP